MLKSIRTMLDMFEEEGIMYCHWKSNENLSMALNGETDLDILFDSTQRSRVEMVLNKCGLKRFRAVPLMQYNAIEDFIGFDKETAKIWHVHLHYRLTLGEKFLKGYTPPWASYVLKNRVFDKEFAVFRSRPEEELFMLFLRIALKLRWRDTFRQLGKNEMNEIQWLKQRVNNDQLISIARERLGDKCAHQYKKLLNGNTKFRSELFPLQKLLRKRMKMFATTNKYISFIKRINRELFWFFSGATRKLGLRTKASRRISPAGGLVVSVIGCDGSGKSSSLKYLIKEFGKKIDVASIYMGSGDGKSSLLRFPALIVAKKISGKGRSYSFDKQGTNKSMKKSLYKFAKIIWAITLAAEKRGKLKKITKLRNNGILVLTDRYPQIEVYGYNDGPLLTDYLNGTSNIMRKVARWELSIYKSAYDNPPDLVVKLMVPINIAMQRKPEMTYEEIERKVEAVKKINLSQNSVEINTDRDKIESCGEIMEEIWKRI